MATFNLVALDAPRAADRSRRDGWLLAATFTMLLMSLWVALARSLPGPFGTVTGMPWLLLLSIYAATDLRRKTICKWAAYTAILSGISLNAIAEFIGPWPALGTIGMTNCFSGAVICLIVILAAYEMSGGCVGDVKLAVAMGSWLGPDHGLMAIADTYLIAAVWILVHAAWTTGPWTLVAALLKQVGAFFLPGLVTIPDGRQLSLSRTPDAIAGFGAVGIFLVLLEPMLR